MVSAHFRSLYNWNHTIFVWFLALIFSSVSNRQTQTPVPLWSWFPVTGFSPLLAWVLSRPCAGRPAFLHCLLEEFRSFKMPSFDWLVFYSFHGLSKSFYLHLHPATGRNMWWWLLVNWWITALHLCCCTKQKCFFLHRSRSIVILPQAWDCSRGEHNSSIYILNEPQLKVVSWRVRVNVLFSGSILGIATAGLSCTSLAPWGP